MELGSNTDSPMALPHGCALIALVPIVISFIALAALLIIDKPDYSWCGVKIRAGDCMLDESERINTCYCIDGIKPNKTEDLYDQAQENCNALNGSLATPDETEKLVWLSKRMYETGIENAFIGLVKRDGRWVWDKPDGFKNVSNIPWRPDFPPSQNGTNAVVTVETRKLPKETKDDYEDEFIYYNYDYHIENDKNYTWYGITTSDRAKIFNVNGYFYYICHYISEPSVTPVMTTIAVYETENDDICECSELEEISLSDLGESKRFQSPRYPKNYCSDLSCRWEISTKHNLAIKLDWLVFDTENKMDFVFVYDGRSGDAPMIQKCSGPHCSDSISSTNYLHVHFNSDHVTTDLGFKAEVTVIETDPCYCSPLVELSLSNMGDSYTIYSPKHPEPYCPNHVCKWTFSVPEILRVGLQLVWTEFDLETTDNVTIFDGQSGEDKRLNSCTGKSCGSVISSRRHVHLRFISDERMSEHTGFVGIVSVVKNYCEKSGLLLEGHSGSGIVTFSEENQYGTIPAGATATNTCPQEHKVWNTYEETFDVTVCQSSVWKKQLKPCVPYCKMPDINRPVLNGSEVHFCRYSPTDKKFMAHNNSVTMDVVDMTKGIVTSTYVFTCINSQWQPEQPTLCQTDKLGIMIIGGQNGKHTTQRQYYKSIDFYYPPPIDQMIKLPFELFIGRSGHIAEVVDHERIIIAGGEKADRPGEARPDSEIINVFNETVVLGPSLKYARIGAASARLHGQIFVCGGIVELTASSFGVCEVFDGTSWQSKPNNYINYDSCMKHARKGLALVVVLENTHYLLAIGGYDESSWETSSAEIYLKGKWEEVMYPMLVRGNVEAAFYGGWVYVCSGETAICELYHPNSTYYEHKYDLAKMNTKRGSFSMVAFGDALFALGGGPQTIEAYYPHLYNKWQVKGQLRNPTVGASAVVWPLIEN